MKTVIITGASGNLGVAVTNVFLESGYRVVATVIAEKDISLLTPHQNLVVKIADLLDTIECNALVNSTVQDFQQINAIILLAGGFAMGGIATTTVSDISNMVALNFETAYNIAQPAYNHMKEQGYGRIVLIGARPALNAADGKSMMAYALSKSLLFRLSEQLNEDAKGQNIVTTVVVPSTIDTALNRKNMPDVNFENWVKPRQLAEIIAFVCSDQADTMREPIIKVYNNS